MCSSDSDSNSDLPRECFIAPARKHAYKKRVSMDPCKQHTEKASRQPTASRESKGVDTKKPSTSRQICNKQDVQTAGAKNLKRKSTANSKLHATSKYSKTGSDGTSSVATHQSTENDGKIVSDTKETYDASGLKDTLHGVIYQLKHLMLVLIRAHEMGYHFHLATEMDAAEKFDDLVLQCQLNTEDKVYRFVQLKHKQDETKRIKAGDLLANEYNDFSVTKYYNSWRKITTNPKFSGSKLKDFILLTNIGLDIVGLGKKDIGVIPVSEQDDFLKVKGKEDQPPRYKLIVEKYSTLHDQLKLASDIHQLARVLAQRVRESQKIDPGTDILERYHVALAKEVIDVGKKRFSDNFIKNNLSATAKHFRHVFSKQLLSDEYPFENDIQDCLETCRLDLSDTFGKNLPLTHESELKQVTDLPNEQTEDTDISEFINVFTIAVDQPNEVELGEMIKRELGDNDMFKLLDANLVGDSFQNDILNWFKKKSGVFLKEGNVGAFFEEIQVKLSSIMTMGLNLDYLGMLKKHDISFKSQNRDLLKFLDSSGATEKPILQLISSKEGLMTALRVQQTLKKTEKYKKADSFIFMPLNKLLPPKTTDTVLRAFKNPRNHNLIVIECGLINEMPNTYGLWNQLDDAIANNAEKRMILIIQGNNDSAVVRFKKGSAISQEKDDDICIDNLEKSSRQKLLERPVVKFQGQEKNTSFARLLNIRDFDDVGVDRSTELSRIIDVDTLVRLIREEEILIGSAVKGLGEIEEYYISRRIVREGGTKDDILDEDEFTERNEQGRIIVLSDVAGMGKSTVLINLARKIKGKEPDMLVIRIDLTQNAHVLENEQDKPSFDNDDTNGAVDFLVDKLSSIRNDLESQVFKTIIKDQGNAALLFDGFDEICLYKDTVIRFLQALAKLRIKKFFLTTRPHATEGLKKLGKDVMLALAFCSLRPFSFEDQMEFLIQFWRKGCGENNFDKRMDERLRSHAQDVIKLLARSINDPENKFTGIPLQTRLVAENFPYPSELPKETNIINLYRGFVSKKYDVFCTEKQCAKMSIPAVSKSCEREWKIFFITHQKFALDSLFDDETVRMLLSSQPGIEYFLDLFKGVIESGVRTGIITEVIEGEPSFIHRTFAEYFAAEFLSNALKDAYRNQQIHEFFLQILFIAHECMTIRYFMNSILQDVSNAPKNKPWKLTSRLRLQLRRPDCLYGTVFHVAATERHIEIIRFLVNCLGRNLLQGRNICNATPLHCAVSKKGNLEVVKYISKNTADINSVFLIALNEAVGANTDLDVIEYLLKKCENINFPVHKDRTVLHKAARAGADSDVVQYLVNKGANIDSLAKDGRTPLHDAVGRGAHLNVVTELLHLGGRFTYTGIGIDEDFNPTNALFPYVRDRMANLQVVKYLLEMGANIDSLANDGRTPLHDAVCGLSEFKYRFNFDSTGGDSSTSKRHYIPLNVVISWCSNLDVIKFLLKNHAKPNFQDNEGFTPLHCAVDKACGLIKYISDRKRIDIRNLDHTMIWEVVILLQKSGSDVNLRDNLGRTPRALAESLIGKLDIYQQVFHKFGESEHPIQLQQS